MSGNPVVIGWEIESSGTSRLTRSYSILQESAREIRNRISYADDEMKNNKFCFDTKGQQDHSVYANAVRGVVGSATRYIDFRGKEKKNNTKFPLLYNFLEQTSNSKYPYVK